MGIINSFLRKLTEKINKSNPASNFSAYIQYSSSKFPDVEVNSTDDSENYDFEIEYMQIVTSGDENVCPMCAQFEGKIFFVKDAPELPLCPSCGCAYKYYSKIDLPANAVISCKNNFVVPAKCTPMISKIQQKIYKEKDINNQIQLCENQIKMLYEFMKPYISAKFQAPNELACRDLLPSLYMYLGKWKEAETTIKICMVSNAYYPKDDSEELDYLKSYQKIATETLSYISQNPGCLQRSIYKIMGYEGEERELLKHFIRNSKQLKKVNFNSTNQLFCKS